LSGKRELEGCRVVIEFVGDNGGWIGAFAFILTLIGLIYTWCRHAISDLKEQLDDPYHRARLTDSRKSDWHAGYFAALEDVTGWADRFYGPRKLGVQAFARCLHLAFAYPVLAALVAWVVANVHAPGGYPLFLDLDDAFGRVWRAGVLCAVAMAFGIYFRNFDGVVGFITGWLSELWPDLTAGRWFPSKARPAVIKLLAFAPAIAIAFAGAVAFAFAVAFAVAFAGAFAGAGIGAVVAAFAPACAFAGAVAVAFAVAFAGAFTGTGAVAFVCAVVISAVAVAVAVPGAGGFAFAGALAVAGAYVAAIPIVLLLLFFTSGQCHGRLAVGGGHAPVSGGRAGPPPEAVGHPWPDAVGLRGWRAVFGGAFGAFDPRP
jgi:hypothetical protein